MAGASRSHAAPLSRDSIAAAALRVSDRGGVSAFSIRAVAAELGVSPMALYYHVTDRDELVALMVEAGFRELSVPPENADDWREELWAIAQWFLTATLRHPHLSALGRSLETTPTLHGMGDRWFAAWRRSGLPGVDAVDAAHASVSAMTAIARAEAVDAGRFELTVRSLVDGLFDRLSVR